MSSQHINCLCVVKSIGNESCHPALAVSPELCGQGSLRTTSLFATSHISATLGKVKPPHSDLLRNFTSYSSSTSVNSNGVLEYSTRTQVQLEYHFLNTRIRNPRYSVSTRTRRSMCTVWVKKSAEYTSTFGFR